MKKKITDPRTAKTRLMPDSTSFVSMFVASVLVAHLGYACCGRASPSDAVAKVPPRPIVSRCKMSGFMESLSFLFLIGLKIPQLFDEFFHGEAAGPGARRELAQQPA